MQKVVGSSPSSASHEALPAAGPASKAPRSAARTRRCALCRNPVSFSLALRLPARELLASAHERPRTRPVGGHQDDELSRGRRRPVRGARERDLLAVGRPGGRSRAPSRWGASPPLSGAVGVHHPDRRRLARITFVVGELASVRTPVDAEVRLGRSRQPGLPRPVCIDHIDMSGAAAVADERDLLSIR